MSFEILILTHNSFEADKWPLSFLIKCSYVVFYNKIYMSSFLHLCDMVTQIYYNYDYGLSVSIHSKRTAIVFFCVVYDGQFICKLNVTVLNKEVNQSVRLCTNVTEC